MKVTMGKIIPLILAMCVSHMAISDENPNDSYPYRSKCPAGDTPSGFGPQPGGLIEGGNWYVSADGKYFFYQDRWGLAQCNCTSFAAYEMSLHIPNFNNSYRLPFGTSWGNGSHWGIAAKAIEGNEDIVVDHFPIPGDVAYWSNTDIGGGYGHVAYVKRVNYTTSGVPQSVDIEEYNYPSASNGNQSLSYGTRTIPVMNPTGFIHILAFEEGVSSLHYMDCAEMFTLCNFQTQQEWEWIAEKVASYRCKNCSGEYKQVADAFYGNSGFGGGAISGTTNPPASGDRPDLTPDFDVYHEDGHEISANCNDCPTENAHGGQVITMRLEVETHNRDVQVSDLIDPNSQSIDGEIRCRVAGVTDWQEILGSEGNLEYDIGNLVTDNDTSVETIPFIVPNYPGSILECQATIDSDNEVTEQDESNNVSRVERFLIMDAPQNINLVVSDLFLTTANPVPSGSPMGAKMAIRNVGSTAPLSNVQNDYLINGPGTNYQWVRIAGDETLAVQLLPGSTQWEEIQSLVTAPTVPGTYTLRAVTDVHNVIPETDEGDNTRDITFTVYASGPDFVTSGLHFCGTPPTFAGDQARFGAWITNQGDRNSPADIRSSYSVQCPGTGLLYLADDGTQASTLSAGVSAFEENLGSVTLPNVAGTCTATFCADYQHRVQETREDNNCTSISFILQPIVFRWSSAGTIAGMYCTQIIEMAEPLKYTWRDNYFCSYQDYGMRWSGAGAISGMRCTQIVESADPYTWNDNFLCVPTNSPLQFFWSSAGPVSGKRCTQWIEVASPSKHTWRDNYLCYD